MSEVENQKAGTQAEDQDGGDAAEKQTTGTPDASSDGGDAGNDEITQLRNQLRESLVWKQKAEESNPLQRELDELRALQSQPQTAQQEPNQTALQAKVARLYYSASNGDEDAIAELQWMQRQEQTNRQLQEHMQMLQVPEADRERVRQGFNANRNRYADPLAYYDAIQGQGVSALKKEVEELRAKLEAKRTDVREGVVGTVTRPVASKEAAQRRSMTLQQFGKEHDRLTASGKREEAGKLAADFASGVIAREA
jgi:hypothetical protein